MPRTCIYIGGLLSKAANSYTPSKAEITNKLVDQMGAVNKTPRKGKRPRANFIRLWDTKVAGFYIQKGTSGTKTWYYKYQTILSREQANYRIGGYPAITTVRARAEAMKLAGRVASGGHPHKERKSDIKAGTLAEYSARYIKTIPKQASRDKEIDYHTRYIVPNLGSAKLKDIKSADIETLRNKYENTPSAANLIKIYLHKFFVWCCKNGYLVSNPAANIKNLKENVRRFSLTDTQFKKIGTFLKTQVKERPIDCFFIGLLIATGCRPVEIYSRKWGDVHFKNKQFVNIASKTGLKTVDLTDDAMNLLKGLQQLTGDTIWLFPSPKDPTTHHLSFRNFWYKLRDETGLGETVQMRDMRHHFAVYVLEQTGDIATVSALLGHANVATTSKHYAYVLNTTKQKALSKVSKGLSFT